MSHNHATNAALHQFNVSSSRSRTMQVAVCMYVREMKKREEWDDDEMPATKVASLEKEGVVLPKSKSRALRHLTISEPSSASR